MLTKRKRAEAFPNERPDNNRAVGRMPPKPVDMKAHPKPTKASDLRVQKIRTGGGKGAKKQSLWEIQLLFEAPEMSDAEKRAVCEQAIKAWKAKHRAHVPVTLKDPNGNEKRYFNTQEEAWAAYEEICRKNGWDPTKPEKPDDKETKSKKNMVVLDVSLDFSQASTSPSSTGAESNGAEEDDEEEEVVLAKSN